MTAATPSRRTDSVYCPKCGALPNVPCRTPSGVVRRDYPHLARKKEWERSRAAAYEAYLEADAVIDLRFCGG